MARVIKTQKTTAANSATAENNWVLLDAEGLVVGRAATAIATVLMGKHKPEYTPHVDCGDYVVVVNAHMVRFTGNPVTNVDHPYYSKKFEQKTYDRYSGYPGGRTVETAADLWQRHPDRILREAVRRMLPKNKLARQMLSKLKLYNGAEHPHQAQQPGEFPEYLLPASTAE